MDARIYKLAARLDDVKLARVLVDAGLDTPRKIKAAKDRDIEAIPGVGMVSRQRIRLRIG